jgi:hypothetical protein
MATVKTKTEGKSGFLKEFFVDHLDASKATIDEAWQEAGNEDTISKSLISKIRKDLALTGKGRSKAKMSRNVGARKPSSHAPKPTAHKTSPKAGSRTTAKANSEHTTKALKQPSKTRVVSVNRPQVLIRLEGEIDDMLHEVKLAGGLPEFEETLRKARRILVRSHGE